MIRSTTKSIPVEQEVSPNKQTVADNRRERQASEKQCRNFRAVSTEL